VIEKPLKTQLNIEDRHFFTEWLSHFTKYFLHLAFSDEFFVYAVRKPNHRNDRIWAKSIEDIDSADKYRELIQNPVCIAIFAMFTAKKLMFEIEENGQIWEEIIFATQFLSESVFPLLKNAENDTRKET
jgi:hypothetical protein